ncbi:MAG: hypothetical protein ABMB14_37495, partial [Myxococcota bacterium]
MTPSRVAAVLVMLGTLVRAWMVFRHHPLEASLYSDMAFLHDRAVRLAAGTFEPSDLQKQLGYSALFAGLLRLEALIGRPVAFGVLSVAQWAASSATLAPVWWTARRWLGERWGLVALAALAFHPYWVCYAAVFLPETFVIAIVSALVWWTASREPGRGASPVLLGLGWGIALWLKGSLV